MKNTAAFFLAAVLAFAFSSCAEQMPEKPARPEREIRGLKGNVKSVQQFFLDSSETPARYSGDSYSQENYSASGNLTDEIYIANKKIASKATYVLDEKGYYVSCDEYLFGKLKFHTVYTYNAEGLVSEEKHLLPDNKVSYIVNRSYDPEGFLIRRNTRLFNLVSGSPAPGIDKYENDSKGNWISLEKCDTAGSPITTYKVRRDTAGNIIANTWERHEYVFDAKGNWIVRTSYYPANPTGKPGVVVRKITYY